MDCSFNVGHHGNLELIRKNLQDNPDKINVEDFAYELSIRLEVESVDNRKEAKIFAEFRELLLVQSLKKFDCKVIDLTSSHFQHFYCNEVLASFPTKEKRGEWLDGMVAVFGKTPSFKKLLKTSTKIELTRSLSPEILFRGDSLSNRLAVSYCNEAIQKNINDFFTFLRKQKKWPKGYVVNNFHLQDKTLSDVSQNADRFQKLITSFARVFLRKQKVNSAISEILKMRESSVTKNGYKVKEAERASASLYWLRFFGNEIMNRFKASEKDSSDPEWSAILTIQTLLTKVSSRCPVLSDEDLLTLANNKVSATHFDKQWTKSDYQQLLQKCYLILLPHFNNYMKRLSGVKIK